MNEKIEHELDESTKKFVLDTRNILFLLKYQHENFSSKQLIEFRSRLESTLVNHHKVDKVFHPLKWRYFRQRYLESFNKDWKKIEEEVKVEVFTPVFFMEKSNHSKKISINSLTDDEKIQIVAPLRASTFTETEHFSINISRASESDIFINNSPLHNSTFNKSNKNNIFELFKIFSFQRPTFYEDLLPEERQEIIDKLCSPKVLTSPNNFNGLWSIIELINPLNENDPYDWYRWEYDLYLIDANCPLSLDKDRDNFEYFFVWRLALTDLYEIKPLLNWHFLNTFYGKANDFKEFIEILLMKYDKMQLNKHLREIINRYLESIEDISELQNEAIEKKIKKSKFEVPIKLTRGAADKFTCLTATQTAILFEYLSESEAILSHQKHHEFLAKENKSKAIQILSGYAYGSISDAIEANVKKKDRRELREVKKIIDKIKLLIDNDLK